MKSFMLSGSRYVRGSAVALLLFSVAANAQQRRITRTIDSAQRITLRG
jgi:hypothetical protein